MAPDPDRTAARSVRDSGRDAPAWRIAALPSTVDLPAAEAFCREVALKHYENFTVATRLVPPRLRQHLANVYAFARWSDDIADEAADPREAAVRLAEWRQGLDDCFAGRLAHPIYVALADTARVTGLSIEPFADLLDAFAEDLKFDAAGRTARYADRPALLAYCRRSADPVGRIVLALEGCREPALVAMSDAICSGLQLVNFWQDLRRDRLAGRVYLPVEDMRRHGVRETMLDDRRATPALVCLVRDEVAWARELFAAGRELADRGPPVLRPAIRMFLAGGLAVADAIERAGFDTLRRRPKVGAVTKLWLAGRAWWDLRSARVAGGPPAGAAR